MLLYSSGKRTYTVSYIEGASLDKISVTAELDGGVYKEIRMVILDKFDMHGYNKKISFIGRLEQGKYVHDVVQVMVV